MENSRISDIRLCLIISGFIFLQQTGLAQNIYGTWKDYYSFTNATNVADAGDKIFCATDGGLFFLDLADNSLNNISAEDGLSDIGIRTLAWNETLKILIVAYQNSNIDFILKDRIINLNDIKRKLLSGDKTVYNAVFDNNRAFLACGFGVVEVDLVKFEIKGTYIIGENGSQVRVFDLESDGKILYAATESGILTAGLDNPNLLDYRNWTKISGIPYASGKFSHLVRFNGELIAVYTKDGWSGDEAYIFRNGEWKRILPVVGYFSDIQANNQFLSVTDREEVFIFDTSLNLTSRIKNYTFGTETISPIHPKAAVCNSPGSVWIADYEQSLVHVTNQQAEQNLPSGPVSNAVFSLTTFQDELWSTPGGRTDPWNNQFRAPVIQQLKEGEWKSYNKKEFPEMTGFFDIVQVVVHPDDPGHIFAASWGGGVLEFKDGKFIKRYHNQNSPLETAIPEQPSEPYCRIGGMAFDSDKLLWITNSQSSKGLHSLSPGGEWKSYDLPDVAGYQFTIGQVIVTRNNDKWIVIPRGKDVYVVNEDGSKKKYLPVTSYFNNGEQEILNRMNDIYSITEDMSGEIWIGTSTGVAVFSNPFNVWKNQEYYAYQPSLELNDGLYHPLLETETVTSIVVDGANRKWLGTKNSGIYLVSEQGDEEILHFTTENSPLKSNTIISMALNEITGELYIGTDKGLISYQGDAPKGNNNMNDSYVYPNPVRETYSGDIVITGLMQNSDVKITDVTGNLVFKGESLGRNMIWNGRNLNGKRVSTGVYLIFCADSSGENKRILKLLVIN